MISIGSGWVKPFFQQVAVISAIALFGQFVQSAAVASGTFPAAAVDWSESPLFQSEPLSVPLAQLFEAGVNQLVNGDLSLAIATFTQVLQSNPHVVEAYCNRGVAYTLSGSYAAAFADFDRAIELEPDYADAYNKRGTAHVQQENWEAALADFDRAIALDSQSVDAYYNRGAVHQVLEDYAAALTDFNQVIQIDPSVAEAYGSRGLVRQALGDRSLALADLQTAAQLFQQQGNDQGYQQTLDFISEIQSYNLQF